MHKQPMTGHPPRLNRSMSTPAKFGATGSSFLNYGGGAGASNLPSLEENPFLRMQDTASQSGLMALAVSDLLNQCVMIEMRRVGEFSLIARRLNWYVCSGPESSSITP